MFREDNPIKPKKKDVNCILLNGGVGDHMGSLVAIDYIIKTYPWINLLVWVPDFLHEFAINVLPGKAIVRKQSTMEAKGYDPNITTINTHWDGRHSPMKIHSVDYAFHVLCDEHVELSKKNYLQVKLDRVDIKEFVLPEKYVAIVTGFTAKVREFSPKTVNEVANYIIQKGYTPVFLGQKETKTGGLHVIKGEFSNEVDYSRGLDYVDRTSLLQAAKIMAQAEAVVGVDCGLLHVAGCTETSIVAGFTTVNPELRAPIRHNILGWNFYPVVPDEDLGCRFCQVKTNFLYGHDYRNCLYKDYKCVSQMTADKFITQLDKIL